MTIGTFPYHHKVSHGVYQMAIPHRIYLIILVGNYKRQKIEKMENDGFSSLVLFFH